MSKKSDTAWEFLFAFSILFALVILAMVLSIFGGPWGWGYYLILCLLFIFVFIFVASVWELFKRSRREDVTLVWTPILIFISIMWFMIAKGWLGQIIRFGEDTFQSRKVVGEQLKKSAQSFNRAWRIRQSTILHNQGKYEPGYIQANNNGEYISVGSSMINW